MDKAQFKTALLSVVNRYLHGTPLVSCDDWQAVYRLAKAHSLTGVFFYATQKAEEVLLELLVNVKEDFQVDAMQQIAQDYYADVLFARFREENIPFMPMKGYLTKRLYPNPEARPSCDLDVFYADRDEKKIEKIFLAEGFSPVIENATHQSWEKGNVTVEMHYLLAGQVPLFDGYYRDVWSRLEQVDGSEYRFSQEVEYLYFLVHAAKHFAGGGFGVRTVLDAYLYNEKHGYDQAYLAGELKKLHLEKFAEQLKGLAYIWFGGGQETEDSRLLGNFVLASGVYGSRKHLAATGDEQSVRGRKAKHLLRTLFPPFRDMKSWYPAVKKFPPLLPFVWVYRWFEVLFTRRQSIASVAEDLKSIDEQSFKAMQRIKEMTDLPL